MEIEIETESKKEGKTPDKYEIECWAKTLIEAEEIKLDAEKMKLVAPILKAKKAAITKLPIGSMKDLKERKKEVDMQEDEE